MTAITCHMSMSLRRLRRRARAEPRGARSAPAWHAAARLAPGGRRRRARRPTCGSRSAGCCAPRGAYVMGRNMFGPVRGPWDEDWRGLVGRRAAVPRAGVRPHPPRPGPGRAAGRHDVSLRHRQGSRRPTEQATRGRGQTRGVDVAGGASTVRQALARPGSWTSSSLDIAPGAARGAASGCSTGSPSSG